MNRRDFLKKMSTTLPAVSLLNLSVACQQKKREKPNIVLILADDLGFGDLSGYGQQYFQSPNIDRLAQEGIRFTQHYAGAPVCAPSRCVLMTGKHTGHAWVRGNSQVEPSGQLPLPANAATFPRMLQANGYQNGCFGKWGLGIAGSSGDPQKHGFNEFMGYYDQVLAHNSFPEFLYKNGEKFFLNNEVVYVSKDHWSKGLGSVASRKNDFANDLILDAALKFIEKNQHQPFFLYLPTTIPHHNDEAPEGERFEIPDLGDFAATDWSRDEKAYAALIQKLDATVGIIEEKLRELHIDENTLIIFTSDNGAIHPEIFPNRFQSNGTLRGYKRDVYEGGIRVPLIVKWPKKVKSGTVSTHISAFQDFFPTICEIAGITDFLESDGISFLPTLLGKPQNSHPYLYWEFHWWKPSLRAVRAGDWKAVQNGPAADVELYHLENDIREQQNLAARFPEKVQELKALMESAHAPSDFWKWE